MTDNGRYDVTDDEIPEIVQQWARQLASDKMLHEIVRLAVKFEERCDIDLTISLRGSGGRAVMEPQISIRR